MFNSLLMYLFMHCKTFGSLASREGGVASARQEGGGGRRHRHIHLAVQTCSTRTTSTTSGFLATSKSTRRTPRPGSRISLPLPPLPLHLFSPLVPLPSVEWLLARVHKIMQLFVQTSSAARTRVRTTERKR